MSLSCTQTAQAKNPRAYPTTSSNNDSISPIGQTCIISGDHCRYNSYDCSNDEVEPSLCPYAGEGQHFNESASAGVFKSGSRPGKRSEATPCNSTKGGAAPPTISQSLLVIVQFSVTKSLSLLRCGERSISGQPASRNVRTSASPAL